MNNIAVIGSQVPEWPYNSSMGYRAGNMIARMMKEGDVLVTGGVEGIGLDAFMGYATVESKGTFTCLMPVTAEKTVGKDKIMTPYSLPEAYRAVSKITGKHITSVQQGEGMAARREILAAMTDVAVMLNGGIGTLHEAIMMMQNSTPVLALIDSGGAAELLYAYHIKDWKYIDSFFGKAEHPLSLKHLDKVKFVTMRTLEESLSRILS